MAIVVLEFRIIQVKKQRKLGDFLVGFRLQVFFFWMVVLINKLHKCRVVQMVIILNQSGIHTWFESTIFYLVASFRQAIRSPRSLGFFRPAKIILVPGMNFLGFSRYSKSVSSLHVIPDRIQKLLVILDQIICAFDSYPQPCWHRCTSNQLPDQSCDRTDRTGWGRPCACHRPRRCGTERNAERTASCPSRHHQLEHPCLADFMWLCKGYRWKNKLL